MNSAFQFCISRRLLLASIISFLFLTALTGSSAIQGRNLYLQHSFLSTDQKLTAQPCSQGLIHNAGRIGLAVNNLGMIGSGWPDSFLDKVIWGIPPSCQYPYPGDKEYLYIGALWVGAVLGDDTLVSVGIDGWQMTREMWPDTCPDGVMRELSIYGGDSGAISEQDYIAVYTDTLTNPSYVIPDPFDGRPHIPLKLEVTQKSYAWSNPEADDFVIFDFRIKNIGTDLLEDVYIGYYVDGDVKLKSPSTGFEDDICGLEQAETRGSAAFRLSLH